MVRQTLTLNPMHARMIYYPRSSQNHLQDHLKWEILAYTSSPELVCGITSLHTHMQQNEGIKKRNMVFFEAKLVL